MHLPESTGNIINHESRMLINEFYMYEDTDSVSVAGDGKKLKKFQVELRSRMVLNR